MPEIPCQSREKLDFHRPVADLSSNLNIDFTE
jgi:hypothetical protein